METQLSDFFRKAIVVTLLVFAAGFITTSCNNDNSELLTEGQLEAELSEEVSSDEDFNELTEKKKKPKSNTGGMKVLKPQEGKTYKDGDIFTVQLDPGINNVKNIYFHILEGHDDGAINYFEVKAKRGREQTYSAKINFSKGTGKQGPHAVYAIRTDKNGDIHYSEIIGFNVKNKSYVGGMMILKPEQGKTYKDGATFGVQIHPNINTYNIKSVYFHIYERDSNDGEIKFFEVKAKRGREQSFYAKINFSKGTGDKGPHEVYAKRTDRNGKIYYSERIGFKVE